MNRDREEETVYLELVEDLGKKVKEVIQEQEVHLVMHWKEPQALLVLQVYKEKREWMVHQGFLENKDSLVSKEIKEVNVHCVLQEKKERKEIQEKEVLMDFQVTEDLQVEEVLKVK